MYSTSPDAKLNVMKRLAEVSVPGSVAQIGIVGYGPENITVLHARRVYDLFFRFCPPKIFDQNFMLKIRVGCQMAVKWAFDSDLTDS